MCEGKYMKHLINSYRR